MKGARRQFFPAANLALQKNRRLGGRRPPDQVAQIHGSSTLTQDAAGGGELRRGHLAAISRRVLQGSPNHSTEMLIIKRFCDHIVGPLPHRGHGALDGGIAGEDHDGKVGSQPSGLPDQFHAIPSGHAQIRQDQVIVPPTQFPQSRVGVRCRFHRISVLAEDLTAKIENLRLVINSQNA